MYLEACPAFAATGKRPKMVLDAPDVATRMARLHGARSAQLLLVSSMRYDVGRRVKEALARRASPTSRRGEGARAEVTMNLLDDVLLWAALPTTTSRQLDCLTRGIDALRGPLASDRELEVVRGRTTETIRRVKVGSRDVFKLDVCEARIREAGTGGPSALPKIVETLEIAIAKHASSLAHGTLLFVFGDHGFAFNSEGIAQSGGATPEEVLVPAFAILTGGDRSNPVQGG
jgi:hypothetical protein